MNTLWRLKWDKALKGHSSTPRTYYILNSEGFSDPFSKTKPLLLQVTKTVEINSWSIT